MKNHLYYFFQKYLDQVWFSKNLRENTKEKKQREKIYIKKRKSKEKKGLNLINYFYTFIQTHFTFFLFYIIARLNNLNIYTF